MVGGTSGSMPVAGELDIVRTRSAAKAMAEAMGFGLVDQTRIATTVSELARNVVVHAGEGVVEIRRVRRDSGDLEGLEIVVSDSGPGLGDLDQALRDGYSTGSGLGVGLGGARRLMDEFTLRSDPGRGTRVRVRKWLVPRYEE